MRNTVLLTTVVVLLLPWGAGARADQGQLGLSVQSIDVSGNSQRFYRYHVPVEGFLIDRLRIDGTTPGGERYRLFAREPIGGDQEATFSVSDPVRHFGLGLQVSRSHFWREPEAGALENTRTAATFTGRFPITRGVTLDVGHSDRGYLDPSLDARVNFHSRTNTAGVNLVLPGGDARLEFEKRDLTTQTTLAAASERETSRFVLNHSFGSRASGSLTGSMALAYGPGFSPNWRRNYLSFRGSTILSDTATFTVNARSTRLLRTPVTNSLVGNNTLVSGEVALHTSPALTARAGYEQTKFDHMDRNHTATATVTRKRLYATVRGRASEFQYTLRFQHDELSNAPSATDSLGVLVDPYLTDDNTLSEGSVTYAFNPKTSARASYRVEERRNAQRNVDYTSKFTTVNAWSLVSPRTTISANYLNQELTANTPVLGVALTGVTYGSLNLGTSLGKRTSGSLEIYRFSNSGTSSARETGIGLSLTRPLQKGASCYLTYRLAKAERDGDNDFTAKLFRVGYSTRF